MDLGENPVKELECMLSEKVNEAQKAGISEESSAREGLQDFSESTNRFSNKAGEIPTSQGITYEDRTEGKLPADTSKGAKMFGGAARILGCISKEAGGSGIL